MATKRVVIPGVVKNGLVVPQNDTPLPEGAHVDIIFGLADVTPALQAEFEQWQASEPTKPGPCTRPVRWLTPRTRLALYSSQSLALVCKILTPLVSR